MQEEVTTSSAPTSGLTGLRTLEQKRAEWQECLYGDDVNSIGYQVWQIHEDLCAWMTINEARNFAPRSEKGEVQGFGLLHSLLNRTFYTSLMLAVNRQNDRNTSKDVNKDVWSLKSLLEDMKKNVHLFTRAAILEEDGVPLDLTHLKADASKGDNFDALLKLRHAEKAHARVDRLTGTNRGNRSAHDRVQEAVFDRMIARLGDATKKINSHCNKFLGHAATSGSRSAVNLGPIVLKELLDAVTVVRTIFKFISDVLVLEPRAPSGAPLPLGQARFPTAKLYDELEYIDCPLVAAHDVPRVIEKHREIQERLSQRPTPQQFLDDLGC